MSAATTTDVATGAATEPARPYKPKRSWTRFLLPTYSSAFILYLSFPIFVIIVFSFNDSRTGFGTAPRVATDWLGFTTRWYQNLFEIPGLTDALQHSLIVAFVSGLSAAILGTLIGLAHAR